MFNIRKFADDKKALIWYMAISLWGFNCLFDEVFLRKPTRVWFMAVSLLIGAFLLRIKSPSDEEMGISANHYNPLFKLLGYIELFAITVGMLVYYYIFRDSVLDAINYTARLLIIYELGIAFGESKEKGKKLEIVIVVSALALFVQGVLNYTLYEGIEMWPSFWAKQMHPRTHHEFYLLMSSALIVLAFCLFRKYRILSIALMIVSILSVGLGIYSQGRITAFSFGITVLVVMFAATIEYSNKSNRKIMYWTVASLVILAIIGYLLFSFNILGIQDAYYHSMWCGSGGIFKNIRWDMNVEQIKLSLQYPMGDCDVPVVISRYSNVQYDHIHNTWIDILRHSGFIPFGLVLVFTIISIYEVYTLWSLIYIPASIRYSAIAEYISLFLFNFVEPGLCASLTCWYMWLFVAGMVHGLVNRVNI